MQQYIEEESRSQNGLNAPLPLTGVRIKSVGDSDPPLIVDHQIYDLVGVLNPFIQTLYRFRIQFC
jgi:hypothetical protein